MKEHRDIDCGASQRRTFLKTGFGIAAALAVRGAAGEAAPVRAGARGLKLGLASYTLRKFTLQDVIRMSKRVALQYLCLKFFHLPLESSPEQIAAAAQKVKEAGLILYGGGVISMRNPQEAKRAFSYAKHAGMKTIVGVPSPSVLPLVNDLLAQYDIQVAIHNHGPGDRLYRTAESAYERIKDLDPRIGLCVDVGHTVRAGADPIDAIMKFPERVLDIHMKDVSAAQASGRCVEMGRGVVDVVGVLRALRAVHYQGVVSFEYEKDPNDPLPGLAESVGYTRGVLAAL